MPCQRILSNIDITTRVEVGESDIDCLTQRFQPGGIICFASLDHAQPLAQDFTGILVTTGIHQCIDDLMLIIGQHDVASRHFEVSDKADRDATIYGIICQSDGAICLAGTVFVRNR